MGWRSLFHLFDIPTDLLEVRADGGRQIKRDVVGKGGWVGGWMDEGDGMRRGEKERERLGGCEIAKKERKEREKKKKNRWTHSGRQAVFQLRVNVGDKKKKPFAHPPLPLPELSEFS